MFNIQHIFATNLKRIRNERNLTQAVLAKKIGTTGNYIAMIEREKKFPSPGMIERIAESLGIESTDLFLKCDVLYANPWNWNRPYADESKMIK